VSACSDQARVYEEHESTGQHEKFALDHSGFESNFVGRRFYHEIADCVEDTDYHTENLDLILVAS